jgi:hypothetical protein
MISLPQKQNVFMYSTIIRFCLLSNDKMELPESPGVMIAFRCYRILASHEVKPIAFERSSSMT